MRNYIEELAKLSGKKAVLGAWVHEIRDLGNLKFLVLKDRTGFLQVTAKKGVVREEILSAIDSLSKESCVLVEGKVEKAAKAPNGIELLPEKIEILSKAFAPVPIDTSGKIQSDLSTRLDYRFLDLRNPKNLAVFKIRSSIFKYSTEFFDSKGFVNIQTPKLTTAGVESGAELFPVLYFGKEAFLSQSPQIYKQMMVAAGFERVYDIGSVFRAEKSHTVRHVTEFTGVDFEMGFIESEADVMDVIEAYFKYFLEKVSKDHRKELEVLGVKFSVPKKIPRITIEEAKKLLSEKGKKLSREDDLDAEAEKLLGEIIQKKFKEDFVFVTEYPWKTRPFYHMKPEGKKDLTKSFDLIWRGEEVATGAQREHRYEVLKAQAKEKGLDLDKMKDYANIFKYGCPPHGGVGLGLDRMVQMLLGLENVKEAILLPRDPERLTP